MRLQIKILFEIKAISILERKTGKPVGGEWHLPPLAIGGLLFIFKGVKIEKFVECEPE